VRSFLAVGLGANDQLGWAFLSSCSMLNRVKGHDLKYGTPASRLGGTGKVAALASAALAAAAAAAVLLAGSRPPPAAASVYASLKQQHQQCSTLTKNPGPSLNNCNAFRELRKAAGCVWPQCFRSCGARPVFGAACMNCAFEALHIQTTQQHTHMSTRSEHSSQRTTHMQCWQQTSYRFSNAAGVEP
jgi:hypothetical protein